MTVPNSSFDVIIIGAGHNGLTAAATLALRGKTVCVLEKSEKIGGMASPNLAHLAHNLNPTVMKELGLAGKINFKELPTVMLSPDGRHVEIRNSIAQYTDGTPHPEAQAYLEICANIRKFSKILAPLALKSPPDISDGFSISTLSEVAGLAKLGLNLKRMGNKDMREFLRVILSNVYDLALDELSDDVLAGNLAADATWGAWAGPRSPGTVFSLLYRYGVNGAPMLPIDGIGAIIEEVAGVVRSNSGEIRTGAGVNKVLVENDRARGVILEDGSQMHASAVMSSVAALQSMNMVGVEHFDVEAARRVRNIRAKGTTAKVNLSLNSEFDIPGLTKHQIAGRMVIAPSATYVEQAFNAVKYGAMAPAPVIEAVIQSMSGDLDNTGSGHVLSAVVQYIPYQLDGGWSAEARDQLTELTINTLSAYAPNIRDITAGVETLSPEDIERQTGAPGGHWHHGEMSTDQLLTVRPVNGMSRYGFGVKGFYLCGAAAHPGGDVNGAAGRNSALQLLKDGALS